MFVGVYLEMFENNSLLLNFIVIGKPISPFWTFKWWVCETGSARSLLGEERLLPTEISVYGRYWPGKQPLSCEADRSCRPRELQALLSWPPLMTAS